MEREDARNILRIPSVHESRIHFIQYPSPVYNLEKTVSDTQTEAHHHFNQKTHEPTQIATEEIHLSTGRQRSFFWKPSRFDREWQKREVIARQH
jgi:hypothetical protein